MAVDRQRNYHKRDRLRQLRAFCYAAKFESMTLSGEHLGISQPAVALHVRELEHELEAVLFDRAGPRVSLTPAGEHLYGLAGPLVETVDRLPATCASELDAPVSGGHPRGCGTFPPPPSSFRRISSAFGTSTRGFGCG